MGCWMEGQSGALVEYGYSIFTYARRYDAAWIRAIEQWKELVKKQQQCNLVEPVAVNVNYFPDESVYQVMSYLDYSDLLVTSTVCSSWNALSGRDELWNRLLITKFSVSPAAIKARRGKYLCNNITSKEIFKEMMTTLRFVLNNLNGQSMRMDQQPVMPSFIHQSLVSVHWLLAGVCV